MSLFMAVLWNVHVQEVEDAMVMYDKLGFPGACCSVDCTHVIWQACPLGLARDHTGKEGVATRLFQVAVNHVRRIISVASSAPGSVNDKTMAHIDPFIQKLRKDPIFTEAEFKLYDKTGTQYKIKGAYAISDNGYHQWRIFQFPAKHATDGDTAKWSRRLESVRKDVECTFGILKVLILVNSMPCRSYHTSLPFHCNLTHRCFP
jgi:hypothetical protein